MFVADPPVLPPITREAHVKDVRAAVIAERLAIIELLRACDHDDAEACSCDVMIRKIQGRR